MAESAPTIDPIHQFHISRWFDHSVCDVICMAFFITGCFLHCDSQVRMFLPYLTSWLAVVVCML